jgi:hypothetical protein
MCRETAGTPGGILCEIAPFHFRAAGISGKTVGTAGKHAGAVFKERPPVVRSEDGR